MLADICFNIQCCKLTEKQQLYLKEQVKDKEGTIRQKFVSIEDKLCEWIRIMSPRGETFDRGMNPFQKFMKMKQYRDSIVHLSSKKVSAYNSILNKISMIFKKYISIKLKVSFKRTSCIF